MIKSLFVVVLLALIPCGCAHKYAMPLLDGHLVIVGGGLKDENAPIFNRFESLCAEGPIGIIPLASGDGIKAGEEVAQRWRKYSATRPVIVIPLTQNDADKADDPTIAAQIRSCGGLWFTGGDQARITKVLRPDPAKHTACYDACLSVLHRNGVIGGTSAGAAMMSDPMITGGRSPSAKTAKNSDPENADGHHVTTAPGMGFFTFGLTDQHFVQRGRLGRLIDAMRDTSIRRGYAVSENCAIIVQRSTGSIEALGDEYAVWLLDASAPNAITPTSADLRVSILATGDVVNGQTARAATPGKDVRGDGVLETLNAVPDVWSLASIRPALERIASSGGRSAKVALNDGRTSLTFIADERTGVFVGIPGRTPCYSNLRVIVEPAAH